MNKMVTIDLQVGPLGVTLVVKGMPEVETPDGLSGSYYQLEDATRNADKLGAILESHGCTVEYLYRRN